MSQFAFLQCEWPDVFETAWKGRLPSLADPRGACFYIPSVHLAELDALFASLQHRAFKGEL